jgi:hypothetical protein
VFMADLAAADARWADLGRSVDFEPADAR